jgi:hypothetical protein
LRRKRILETLGEKSSDDFITIGMTVKTVSGSILKAQRLIKICICEIEPFSKSPFVNLPDPSTLPEKKAKKSLSATII